MEHDLAPLGLGISEHAGKPNVHFILFKNCQGIGNHEGVSRLPEFDVHFIFQPGTVLKDSFEKELFQYGRRFRLETMLVNVSAWEPKMHID